MNNANEKRINDLVSSLEEPMKELAKIQKQKLDLEKENVLDIINNKIKVVREIEKVLDNLLDLTYWYGDETKEIYYKLLNYVKEIDEKVANDYEEFYLEIIKEQDELDEK